MRPRETGPRQQRKKETTHNQKEIRVQHMAAKYLRQPRCHPRACHPQRGVLEESRALHDTFVQHEFVGFSANARASIFEG